MHFTLAKRQGPQELIAVCGWVCIQRTVPMKQCARAVITSKPTLIAATPKIPTIHQQAMGKASVDKTRNPSEGHTQKHT